jgi:hypothetical protein
VRGGEALTLSARLAVNRDIGAVAGTHDACGAAVQWLVNYRRAAVLSYSLDPDVCGLSDAEISE